VELSIYDDTDPKYWDETLNGGAGGWGSEHWNLASGSATWTYTNPGWSDGHQYIIKSRAVDTAGNTETTVDQAGFHYDISAPESYITRPLDTSHLKDSVTPKGTAYDGSLGSGIPGTGIKICVEDLNPDPATEVYWNVGAWQLERYWCATSGGADWILPSTPTWKNGHNYRIATYAQDWAGNYEVTYATITYIYDTQAPQASLTIPQADDHKKTLTEISGTSSDNKAGVKEVKLKINRQGDNYYWNGSTWVVGGQDLTADTTSWSYGITDSAWTDGQKYSIWCWSVDYATNTGVVTSSHTFTYDTSPPSSVVDIPEGGQTYDTLNQLSGTAQDDSPGVLTNVWVTINKDGTNFFWDGSTWTDTGARFMDLGFINSNLEEQYLVQGKVKGKGQGRK